MGKLIQDIVPLYDVPSFKRGYGGKASAFIGVDTDDMIEELYYRRASISRIFGVYYALDANADHLTVGDVELAGLALLPDQPKLRQPF